MKIGTVLMLLAAIVAGSLAVMTTRAIIQSHAGVRGSASTIVVAAENLGFGEALSDDNVAEIPWSSSALPQGAFKTKADLLQGGRRVVLSGIAKDEPILASRVTGPGQRGSLSVLIEPGMRAVTVRVDDVRGVAGFVLPEDHVDVLLSRVENNAANPSTYADVLLQNIKVLAVDQLASMKQENPTVAKAVTLEVTAEQAQKLVLASGVGSLSLVLRKAGGAEPTATRRVTLVDLGQGEYNRADRNDAKDSGLSRRIDELEAQLQREMNKPLAAAPRVSRGAGVKIIRGVKAEDYNVYSESD